MEENAHFPLVFSLEKWGVNGQTLRGERHGALLSMGHYSNAIPPIKEEEEEQQQEQEQEQRDLHWLNPSSSPHPPPSAPPIDLTTPCPSSEK